MRKPVTQKRKKARGGRTSDAKDDINHNQTVPWTCDTIVGGLKVGVNNTQIDSIQYLNFAKK